MFSKLTLYTSTQCVQCNGVRRYLTAKGVNYVERDFETISARIENEVLLGAKSKPILMHELGSTVELLAGSSQR